MVFTCTSHQEDTAQVYVKKHGSLLSIGGWNVPNIIYVAEGCRHGA